MPTASQALEVSDSFKVWAGLDPYPHHTHIPRNTMGIIGYYQKICLYYRYDTIVERFRISDLNSGVRQWANVRILHLTNSFLFNRNQLQSKLLLFIENDIFRIDFWSRFLFFFVDFGR